MKTYLNNKSFYAMTENKLVYKVSEFETYDGYDSIHYSLELIAGWDYINPDWTNEQGFCKAENFVDDVQSETVIQYFFLESMAEAFAQNDYIILTEFNEIIH